jgi:hypothetical protein
MGFSDKNWVGIGLNWVRFHFLKKAKLVKSSMFERGFAFFELGSFSHFCVFCQRDAGPNFLTTDGHRHRSPSPRLRRDGGFAPVRGEDGHGRSFITRDFNRA